MIDLVKEAEIFTDKIHSIVLDFYPDSYYFIGRSILYYFLMTIGSIFMKHNYHLMYLNKLYSYNYKNHSHKKSKVITDISYIEDGWGTIGKEEFNMNYINPKFSIIDEYLLPDFLSKKEFIEFDTYITIDLLLKDNKEHAWVSGSAMFPGEFMDCFIKNHDEQLTKEEAINFVERINTKYLQFGHNEIQGLISLIYHLKEKFKL